MFIITTMKTGAAEGPMGIDELAVYIENHNYRVNEDKLDALLSMLSDVEGGVPFEDVEDEVSGIAASLGFEISVEE